MTTGRVALKVRYLDASALVMLLVDEGDCGDLRAFCNGQANCRTTALCLAEALGALKRKWLRGEPTTEEYFRLTGQLVAEGRHRIYPTEPELTDPVAHARVEALARKYELDLADALQLYTLRQGPFHHFCGESASVLVTGDQKLADAAAEEGLRVWNCRRGQAPDWA